MAPKTPKDLLVGRLKRFDDAYGTFWKELEKLVTDLSNAGDKGINVTRLVTFAINLNAKYIAMPCAFRRRLREMGFEKLLDCAEESCATRLIVDKLYLGQWAIDNIDVRILNARVRGELRILETIIKDNEVDSYFAQFDTPQPPSTLPTK